MRAAGAEIGAAASLAPRLLDVVVEAPLPTMLHADDGEILAVSRSVEELSGHPAASIRHIDDWLRLAYGERAGEVALEIEQAFEGTERPEPHELALRTAAGESRTWRFHASSPARLPDGRRCFLVVAVDVTAEQLAREALERSEALMRQLATAIPHVVWTTGASGDLLFFNRRGLAFLGRKAEEMLRPTAWLRSIHPAERQAALDAWRRCVESGGEYGAELRLRRADGTWVWHNLRAVPIADGDGRVQRWIGTATDIDELRRSEDRARKQLLELELVHEISSRIVRASRPEEVHSLAIWGMVAALAVDRCSLLLREEGRGMRFVAWHELSERYRARTEGHLLWAEDDEPRPILVADAEQEPSLAELREVIRAEGIRSLAFVPLSFDGDLFGKFTLYRDRPHCWTAEEVRLAETIANHVAFALARRRAEDGLRESYRKKDDFLAVLGHELRTPLGAISSAVEVLEGGDSRPEDAAWARGMVRAQVEHMRKLLDDLLDLGRISRGRIELRRRSVHLRELVERVAEGVRPLLRERRHGFSVSIEPQGLAVDGDPTRLGQIVANLLTNAARYTEPGGTIRLEAAAAGPDVRLSVSDDGVGLSEQDLARIFEPFEQAQGRGRSGGLGIGLALVRRLAVLHGGDVQAHSEGRGRGSRFTVRLPRARAGSLPEPRAPERRPLPAQASPSVLVVEDDADAARALALLVEALGGHSAVVTTGREAIERARKAPPRVALLDLDLPDLSGFAVAEILREELGEQVLLVAVTGYGDESTRERLRACCFDRHLLKPISPGKVRELLEEAATRAASGAG